MDKWTVNIDDEPDRRFREVVFRVKEFRKGAFKEALEETIEL